MADTRRSVLLTWGGQNDTQAIHLPTSLIALFMSFSPPAHGDESGNSSTLHWQIGARNVDGGSRAYGEVTEQIPQEGAPGPGGPPSQEHPTVSASDPSMWDEQPHQVCVSDGGRIPDMEGYSQPRRPLAFTQVRDRLPRPVNKPHGLHSRQDPPPLPAPGRCTRRRRR